MKSPIVVNSQVLKHLEELRDKACSQLVSDMKKVKEGDADLELAIVEKCNIDELRKILDVWIESLAPYKDYDLAQGVACGLLEFDSYLEVLQKETRSVFNDD